MTVPKPARVRVRDLAKAYGRVEALRGASFDAAPGEIFGLLGPNGAGKTTALECILGLRHPDSGSVEIGGIDALARPHEAKQLLGAQLQAAALQDKVTPRKALALFASFYGEPAGVGELVERFGLSEKADAPFDSLSGGLRQRLFLALAFVNNPSVVLLDEPTAGLDPASRRTLRDAISGMRGTGRTVLLCTHDIEEAERLCDKVAIIDGGRIVAAASPAELMSRSRSGPSILLRTVRPVEESWLLSLPAVTGCRADGRGWLLGSASVNETIAGLVRGMGLGANELTDLRVVRPSLEDVFLSLTGRAWDGGPAEDR
jgi:ABC-2 type transport system ATP-binding protein